MKLVLISEIPPTVEVIFGPSSFIYHLLKNRPKEIELYLFYYYRDSINSEVEKEIEQLSSIETHQICTGNYKIIRVLKRLIASHKFRLFVKKLGVQYKYPYKLYELKSQKKTVEKINKINPDLIWLYPHVMLYWYQSLSKYNILVSGPDCTAIFFERLINNAKLEKKNRNTYDLFRKLDINLEKSWGNSTAQIHFVGKKDVSEYKKITNSNNCFYFKHPFCNPGNIETEIKNVKGKISILISKGLNIVNRDHINVIVRKLVNSDSRLKQKFKFKFIGHGFEKYLNKLKDSNFEVDHTFWVDSYKLELNKHQIQLIPRVAGAGTKNSVLDSMASGLLCIGTKYSFENIDIVNNKDMIMYENPDEIEDILKKIIDNPIKYSNIAQNGKLKIRKNYDPKKISIDFFNYVQNLFNI